MSAEVDVWIRDLDSWWPPRARRAAESLARATDPRAVEPLLRVLERHGGAIFSWGRRVRCLSAINALAVLGDRRAVEPLLRVLDGLLGAAFATEARGVRCVAAINALAALGDRRAVPVLIRAANHWDTSIGIAAAGALGILGDPRAVPVLVRVLGDPVLRSETPAHHAACAHSLVCLGKPALVPLVEAVRVHFGLGLGYWVEKVVRETAIEAPAGAEDEAAAVLADGRAAACLLRALARSAPWLCQHVVDAWVRLGSAAVPHLTALLEQPDARVRRCVAEALGRLGGPDVPERLLALLADPVPGSALAGAIGLACLGDPRGMDHLLPAVERGGVEEFLSATGALGRLGDPAGPALVHLRRRLGHITALGDGDQMLTLHCEQACKDTIHKIETALRTVPTELEAASAPAGLGTELEASDAEGRGTELIFDGGAGRGTG